MNTTTATPTAATMRDTADDLRALEMHADSDAAERLLAAAAACDSAAIALAALRADLAVVCSERDAAEHDAATAREERDSAEREALRFKRQRDDAESGNGEEVAHLRAALDFARGNTHALHSAAYASLRDDFTASRSEVEVLRARLAALAARGGA